jgi:hypothetical protein
MIYFLGSKESAVCFFREKGFDYPLKTLPLLLSLKMS